MVPSQQGGALTQTVDSTLGRTVNVDKTDNAVVPLYLSAFPHTIVFAVDGGRPAAGLSFCEVLCVVGMLFVQSAFGIHPFSPKSV